MNGPKRVIVEYDDGTHREAQFGALSKQAQTELSALGVSDVFPKETPISYILLQWKDGWKEVVAVEEPVTDMLRYYTIERVEEVGRLSLNTTNGCPDLLLIKRLPGQVESILFIGKEGPQAYALEEKVTVREGGKVEHIFYDKKRPNFRMEEASTASFRYRVVLDSLRAELQKKGLDGRKLLAMAEAERTMVYKELAQALGLRGSERQRDVYRFLEAAVKKLDAPA
jgi:hypothetical protein